MDCGLFIAAKKSLPAEKAKEMATRLPEVLDPNQRRLGHEGHTTCEKRVQFYSYCVLARELNAEKYDQHVDGRDDGADDQHDERYLGGTGSS